MPPPPSQFHPCLHQSYPTNQSEDDRAACDNCTTGTTLVIPPSCPICANTVRHSCGYLLQQHRVLGLMAPPHQAQPRRPSHTGGRHLQDACFTPTNSKWRQERRILRLVLGAHHQRTSIAPAPRASSLFTTLLHPQMLSFSRPPVLPPPLPARTPSTARSMAMHSTPTQARLPSTTKSLANAPTAHCGKIPTPMTLGL